jgi:hypothetical protein
MRLGDAGPPAGRRGARLPGLLLAGAVACVLGLFPATPGDPAAPAGGDRVGAAPRLTGIAPGGAAFAIERPRVERPRVERPRVERPRVERPASPAVARGGAPDLPAVGTADRPVPVERPLPVLRRAGGLSRFETTLLWVAGGAALCMAGLIVLRWRTGR